MSRNHIDILRKLRKLVEADISQNKLRKILIRLRNMVKSSTPAPVPQPTLPPVHDWSSQPFPSHFPQGVSLLQAYPQLDIAASTAAIVNSITPMPNIPANVTDILSSLLNAGVLSTSGISATVKSSAIENETSSESKKTHSTDTEVPFYRECRFQYLRLSENNTSDNIISVRSPELSM